MKTAKISAIQPDEPSTWENSVFLTVDVDWACDEVVMETITILEKAEVEATWFITHETPLLERLRDNPKFELAIHPNFNPLLLNGNHPQNAEQIVEQMMRLVPEAVSVRSHSMTQSSRLLDIFRTFGLTHDCNHYIPFEAGISLKPWRYWNGLIKVPYSWEDDLWVLEGKQCSAQAFLNSPGLKVLDFHPIHVALNTADLAVYERSREVHGNWPELQRYVHDAGGTKTFLEDALALLPSECMTGLTVA